MKTYYVAGFMFDPTMNYVALIRKNKPEWQKGLLNGIGGKIEDGESPNSAMIREFGEEARYAGTPDWKHFCMMSGTNNDGSSFGVYFYWSFGDLHRLTSNESEQIEIVTVPNLLYEAYQTVGNVKWLVALAVDCGKGIYPPYSVHVRYEPKREVA